MHPDIEKLIDLAIADGQITEKERNVILKKASQLGVDEDEAEMYLDGKLHQMKNQANKPTKEKHGNIKTCPACGAEIFSFTSKCLDCGHEFRNIESVSSIKELNTLLLNAEKEERNKPRSWIEKIDGELAVAKAVANRQKSIISSFPVPNTKEDLLEFLSIASSESRKKLGFFIASIHPDAVLKNAWKAKCEQLIFKARLSMKDDNKSLEEIENYAKQIGIK